MSLIEVYANQYRWRRWPAVYRHLGNLAGARVVDLGCGIGDQSADLARLGADVLGVDANHEVIAHATSRGIANARFVCAGISDVAAHRPACDGVWASFTAAYFAECDDLLRVVAGVLAADGWLALTELDDLFGHRPLAPHWVSLVERYYAQSLAQGRYRFRSHEHVVGRLVERGWRVEVDTVLDDDEFAFLGPAAPEVLAGWKTRLALMMPHFLDRFGDEARGFDVAFLDCLASAAHRSESRVWFLLARAPAARR